MHKKSQIEMIEMLMVLVVIVIMIAIGILFYFGFFVSNLPFDEISQQESSVLLATVSLMPEFQCSQRATDSECIDTLKLFAFRGAISNRYKGHYASLFKWKRIQFERVYPEPLADDECEIGDDYQKQGYPDNCAFWTVYENELPNPRSYTKISTPVSLYYPNTKESAVGRLNIETYAK